jgi:chromosome partitioning protein
MATIISLANQKGGVGKTTTTINLGAAMAELGRRVLLVDFDPQGAATVGVGLNPNELDITVYNLLLDPSVDVAGVVQKSPKAGVDILPANIDLAAAEVVLVGEVAREQALGRALKSAQDEYDFILIDCPPSLGLLTVNALTASDSVLIPMECEFFALRGMKLLIDTIEKVRERLNPRLEVQGILATMYDGRTIHSREVLERVREAFGEKLFKTNITRTIRFAEAPVAGEAILTYAPESGGAAQYRALAKEVLGIHDQESQPAEGGRAVPSDGGTDQLELGGTAAEPGNQPGATSEPEPVAALGPSGNPDGDFPAAWSASGEPTSPGDGATYGPAAEPGADTDYAGRAAGNGHYIDTSTES